MTIIPHDLVDDILDNLGYTEHSGLIFYLTGEILNPYLMYDRSWIDFCGKRINPFNVAHLIVNRTVPKCNLGLCDGNLLNLKYGLLTDNRWSNLLVVSAKRYNAKNTRIAEP